MLFRSSVEALGRVFLGWPAAKLVGLAGWGPFFFVTFLAALPGLSGATLRIFYSFMVPVFGGRLWTTLTTWSLLAPAQASQAPTPISASGRIIHTDLNGLALTCIDPSSGRFADTVVQGMNSDSSATTRPTRNPSRRRTRSCRPW